jgi:hypothetical protein
MTCATADTRRRRSTDDFVQQVALMKFDGGIICAVLTVNRRELSRAVLHVYRRRRGWAAERRFEIAHAAADIFTDPSGTLPWIGVYGQSFLGLFSCRSDETIELVTRTAQLPPLRLARLRSCGWVPGGPDSATRLLAVAHTGMLSLLVITKADQTQPLPARQHDLLVGAPLALVAAMDASLLVGCSETSFRLPAAGEVDPAPWPRMEEVDRFLGRVEARESLFGTAPAPAKLAARPGQDGAGGGSDDDDDAAASLPLGSLLNIGGSSKGAAGPLSSLLNIGGGDGGPSRFESDAKTEVRSLPTDVLAFCAPTSL